MTFEQALSKLKQTSPLRITVSGDIGSGKSTFAKRLAQELGVPRVYIGGLMREEAAKRGMTLDAFNALLETDDAVDRQMDAMQRQKAREVERGIFEGRVAWHFVEEPDAKVFFSVDPAIAAERIWQDDNAMRDKYSSLEALIAANEERKQSENERYAAYYSIDAYDQKNFDVVIDTTEIGIPEVFERAVIAIAEHLG